MSGPTQIFDRALLDRRRARTKRKAGRRTSKIRSQVRESRDQPPAILLRALVHDIEIRRQPRRAMRGRCGASYDEKFDAGIG